MKKNVIAKGLNGLLAAAPEVSTQTPTGATETAEKKQVTYNLNAELLEKIRYIGFVSKRKNNAIVAEAVENYVNEWEQEHGKINVIV